MVPRLLLCMRWVPPPPRPPPPRPIPQHPPPLFSRPMFYGSIGGAASVGPFTQAPQAHHRRYRAPAVHNSRRRSHRRCGGQGNCRAGDALGPARKKRSLHFALRHAGIVVVVAVRRELGVVGCRGGGGVLGCCWRDGGLVFQRWECILLISCMAVVAVMSACLCARAGVSSGVVGVV